MLYNLFIKTVICLSLLLNTAYAQEVITSYDNSTLPVLNEELRKIRYDLTTVDTDTDTDIYVKATTGDTVAGYLDGKTWKSITVDTSNMKLQLSGDSAAPGNSYLYATNGSGTKGWYASSGYSAQLSNVVFSYGGCPIQSSLDNSGCGWWTSTTGALPDSASNGETAGWFATGGTYRTVIESKFKKISGISTVTFWAYVAGGDTHYGDVVVNIGGQTGTASPTGATAAWVSGTVDVSGLTNGTTYDCDITIRGDSDGVETMLMYAIIGIAS